MTTVAELLKQGDGGVPDSLVSASAALVDTIGQFLKVGGDPVEVRRVLAGVNLLAEMKLSAAEATRKRVRDLGELETEQFIKAQCFARPKHVEEKR
jgi:hypothetical protein